MTTPSGPPVVPGGYHVASLGYRVLVGGLRLIPLLILLVGLPDAALAYLSSHGIALPVSVLTVTVAGITIGVLSTVRYLVRPTRAYGPVSILTSAVVLAYLFVLWLGASYRVAVPSSSVVLTIGYADLIGLLLIVPALGVAAGLVTSVEDLLSPGERLPFDFPP